MGAKASQRKEGAPPAHLLPTGTISQAPQAFNSNYTLRGIFAVGCDKAAPNRYHGGRTEGIHTAEAGEYRLSSMHSLSGIAWGPVANSLAGHRHRSVCPTASTTASPLPHHPPLRLILTENLTSHWRRAFAYARREDWIFGAGMAAVAPSAMLITERFAPSFAGKGGFPPVFRLSCAIGLIAGTILVWERSCCTSQPIMSHHIPSGLSVVDLVPYALYHFSDLTRV